MSKVELLRAAESPSQHNREGSSLVIGTLVALTEDGGQAFVVHPGQSQSAALIARSTVPLDSSHIGHEVILAFENKAPDRPIVLGCIRPSGVQTRPDPDTVRIVLRRT